jgi:hypothetical protein
VTRADRERELGFLRDELLEELREHWALDDRWAPWKPEPDEDGYVRDWAERDEQRRRDRVWRALALGTACGLALTLAAAIAAVCAWAGW